MKFRSIKMELWSKILSEMQPWPQCFNSYVSWYCNFCLLIMELTLPPCFCFFGTSIIHWFYWEMHQYIMQCFLMFNSSNSSPIYVGPNLALFSVCGCFGSTCISFSSKQFSTLQVNLSGAEPGIFQDNWVNIMTADALALQGARSSAAMILIVCNVDILAFHRSEF